MLQILSEIVRLGLVSLIATAIIGGVSALIVWPAYRPVRRPGESFISIFWPVVWRLCLAIWVAQVAFAFGGVLIGYLVGAAALVLVALSIKRVSKRPNHAASDFATAVQRRLDAADPTLPPWRNRD